jgi:Helix-turn-helix domain
MRHSPEPAPIVYNAAVTADSKRLWEIVLALGTRAVSDVVEASSVEAERGGGRVAVSTLWDARRARDPVVPQDRVQFAVAEALSAVLATRTPDVRADIADVIGRKIGGNPAIRAPEIWQDAWTTEPRDDSPAYYGRVLRRRRGELHRTLDEIARASGRTVKSLRDIEAGRTTTPESFDTLLGALDTDRRSIDYHPSNWILDDIENLWPET